MKNIKFYFIDMITDNSGHINSKIVLGILSFIVAIILALLKYPTEYPIIFLTFSSGCFGFSSFDNRSAFKFNYVNSKTETKNKETKTEIDVAKVVDNAGKILKKK